MSIVLQRSSEPGSQSASLRSRELYLEKVVNIRDLGGLPCATGWTRPGTVFRSATMHCATEADAQLLTLVDVQTVIDLRSAEERLRWPGYGAWRPNTIVHAPLLRTPWRAEDALLARSPDAFLADRYLEMFDQSGDALRMIAHTIADSDAPVVFHCAAGKDRTGVVAALLLGLVGVPGDRIADDYHHTAVSMERLKDLFREDRNGDQENTMVSQPAAFLEAPREAMTLTLSVLLHRWSTMQNYVESIGVSDEVISRLSQRLVQ